MPYYNTNKREYHLHDTPKSRKKVSYSFLRFSLNALTAFLVSCSISFIEKCPDCIDLPTIPVTKIIRDCVSVLLIPLLKLFCGAVGATLSTTLAIDYDGLIIPAGKRHIDTLEHDAHAKRVLRAFLREDMPVLLQGDANSMLQFIEDAADRAHATAESIGGAPNVDGRLVTIAVAHNDLAELEAFDAAVGSVADKSRAA